MTLERHIPTTVESIGDINIHLDIYTSAEGAQYKQARAEVQKLMSTGYIRNISVDLKNYHQSQGHLQEMRLLSAYLDWIKSEANVNVLPEGVGERIAGEALWVRSISLLEKIAQAVISTGNTEAQVFTALETYIESQL